MNRAAVNSRNVPLPDWSGARCDALGDYSVKVLDFLKKDNWDLSILLCDDKTIKALNAQYRDKAETTDVLSFELGTEAADGDSVRYLPGDIVISIDTLKENSVFFKITEDEELRRLLIHGILHLNGMDHKTNDITEPMLALQEDILKNFNNEHIIPGGDKK